MTDKTWKATERYYADRFGGERVPITGRIRGNVPDIRHKWLSIEVKFRKELPAWLHDAMDQAQKSKHGEQLPVVILHQNGKKHDDDFIVMTTKDFEEWFL